MTLGLDHLGLAHPLYPIDAVIKLIPRGWAIGCFDDPFGNAIPNLLRILDANVVSAIRIHAHWSDVHAIVPIDKLTKKLPKYEQLAKQYPNVKIYVSHSCEYNDNRLDEIKKRVALIRKLAPSCIPVNSRMRGPLMDGVSEEHHGNVTGAIVSMDGTDIRDINVKAFKAKNKGAILEFGWGNPFNLREYGKPAPPPMKRTKPPTPAYIQSVTNQMKG